MTRTPWLRRSGLRRLGLHAGLELERVVDEDGPAIGLRKAQFANFGENALDRASLCEGVIGFWGVRMRDLAVSPDHEIDDQPAAELWLRFQAALVASLHGGL